MVNRMDHKSTVTEQISSNHDIRPKLQIEKIQLRDDNKNEEKLSRQDAQTMTDSMNKFLQSADSQLKFVFHDELNEYYVTIVNSATDEVIREIPSKKLMDIHAAMKEFVGILVDRKI